MIRTIKATGLALLAVFALSAVAASAASAEDVFTVEGGGSTAVSGVSEGNDVFTATNSGLKVQCTTGTYTATAVANGAKEVTVNATYEGKINETPHGKLCAANAGSLEFNMNGCDYDLTGKTTQTDEGKTDAVVSLTCPTGKEALLVDSLGCTIEFPAQTPTTGGVTYVNEGKGVRVKTTETGLTYTNHGAFCPFLFPSTTMQDLDFNDSVLLLSTTGKKIEVSGS